MFGIKNLNKNQLQKTIKNKTNEHSTKHSNGNMQIQTQHGKVST